MDAKEKTRENRLRRMASRQGYRLAKNPRRDPRAVDYGSYMLLDAHTGNVEADFGWDHVWAGDHLAEVEAFLTGDARRVEK